MERKSEDVEPTQKIVIKVEDTRSREILEIIQNLAQCLQNDECDIDCLKSFLNVMNSCNDNKEEILKLISAILTYTEETTVAEVRNIFAQFQGIIMPERLNSLVINRDVLKDITFIEKGGYGVISSGWLNIDNKKTEVIIKGSIPPNETILKQEANIMAQLDHPNIVKILGVITNPFGIVMEYANLGTLRENLLKRMYDENNILRAIVEIASGMEYLETRNIIHRDLNLSNIFIDNIHCCKIGDFGFSRHVEENKNFRDTLKDFEIITNHSAPEILSNQIYTTKGDVYSMGLLVWDIYMIAGNQQNYYMYPAFLCVHSEHPFRMILNNFHETGELVKPRKMPRETYFYIKNYLLNANPDKRPTFCKIKEKFSRL